MAHKVTFDLPRRELGREDIVFVVHKDDKRFGTLLISKGAVECARPTRSTGARSAGTRSISSCARSAIASDQPMGPPMTGSTMPLM